MISKIKKLNKDLSKSFVMKDLGATKKILGMKITCDENGKKKKKKSFGYLKRGTLRKF